MQGIKFERSEPSKNISPEAVSRCGVRIAHAEATLAVIGEKYPRWQECCKALSRGLSSVASGRPRTGQFDAGYAELQGISDQLVTIWKNHEAEHRTEKLTNMYQGLHAVAYFGVKAAHAKVNNPDQFRRTLNLAAALPALSYYYGEVAVKTRELEKSPDEQLQLLSEIGNKMLEATWFLLGNYRTELDRYAGKYGAKACYYTLSEGLEGLLLIFNSNAETGPIRQLVGSMRSDLMHGLYTFHTPQRSPAHLDRAVPPDYSGADGWLETLPFERPPDQPTDSGLYLIPLARAAKKFVTLARALQA